MFRSIKNKLIFLFLIAVLTPLLVMRLIAYPSAQKIIQETTISNLQSIGSEKVSQINDWFSKLRNHAESIARNPFVVAAVQLTKTDIDTISQFISRIPCDTSFHGYVLSDISGIIRVATDKTLIGMDISKSEGFDYAAKGVISVSDSVPTAFYDPNELGYRSMGIPAIYFWVPIKNGSGSTVGIMMLHVDISDLSREWQETRYGGSYDVYVINRHGLMISGFRFGEYVKSTKNFRKMTDWELAVVEPHTKIFTKSVASCLKGTDGLDVNGYTNYTGEKVLGTWYWIPELKWGVITEIRANEVSLAINNLKNPFSKILSYLTISGVILAVAGIAFAFLIGQKIANPIMQLITATRKMSAGDLSQRVMIHTEDEVRELGDAFNVMIESVREKTSKLQETTNFLHSILISSTEYSIIAEDLNGMILAFNEGAKRMYGYEPEELIQKSNVRILHTKDGVELESVQKILETTLLTGRYESEMQFVRKNGEILLDIVLLLPGNLPMETRSAL